MAKTAWELAALGVIGAILDSAPRELVQSPARRFLQEIADEGARQYRATDGKLELFAGIYSDGRIRLADENGRRFAGALHGSHANVIDLGTRAWSELILRATPTGRMQLELHGGPYGDCLLNCEML